MFSGHVQRLQNTEKGKGLKNLEIQKKLRGRARSAPPPRFLFLVCVRSVSFFNFLDKLHISRNLQKKTIICVKKISLRHRACAQACKSVLVTLREVTSCLSALVIFFNFNAFGGFRILCTSVCVRRHPQNHGFFLRFGKVLASRRAPRAPPFSWRLRSTKNQYFLSPEHLKSICFVPGATKINTCCP